LVKLQYDNNKQYKLTLPKALIDAKGWKKSSEIKIELNSEGNIVLKLVENKENGKR
jgi:antitoxin component of MazEF toxin-antitoxin module